MKVIGPQSTRAYLPGNNRNHATIARELGVRYLLEGSVSRSSGQMHVSLRLIDSRGSQLPWIQTYERSTKDIFALQSEITHAIAAQLQTRISSNETKALDAPPTSDLRAYDLYLQARALGTNAPSEVAEVSPMVSGQFHFWSKPSRAIPTSSLLTASWRNGMTPFSTVAKWDPRKSG